MLTLLSVLQAILFLQQLLDFHETAGAMLASQGKATAAPPAGSHCLRPPAALLGC